MTSKKMGEWQEPSQKVGGERPAPGAGRIQGRRQL